MKEKRNHSFDIQGEKTEVLIKLLWNNIILFSFTLTILIQNHFNRLCKSEFAGPFIISLNSLSKSIPRDIENAKQSQTQNNIYFMKVSLACLLAEDKGGKSYTGSPMIYYYILETKHRSLKIIRCFFERNIELYGF